jgi:hypothetical protein
LNNAKLRKHNFSKYTQLVVKHKLDLNNSNPNGIGIFIAVSPFEKNEFCRYVDIELTSRIEAYTK